MPVSDAGRRRALGALVWFHRWLGIATCLIVAAWFASGAVMVFQPFPSLSRADQLQLEAPVATAEVAVAPGAALARAGVPDATLRLVQRAGRAAYLVEGGQRTWAIDAATGARLPLIGTAAARAEAVRLFGAGASASGPVDYDQWVVHNRFDPARPFYRLDAHDGVGTEAYLSARTGELVQRTTRRQRAWNWPGAVLHWVYVTPLRSSWTAWDGTVWWLSLVCLLVVIAGTVLGVIRLLAARRLRPPAFSFYRQRWLRWHHLLGLGTAVFVLSWMLSGWLSMDHGRLFSRGTPDAGQAQRFAGCTLARALEGEGLAAVRGGGGSREIGFTTVACSPVVTRYAAAGRIERVNGAGRPIDDRDLRGLLEGAARAGWPQARLVRVGPVDPTGTLALAEGWPASAWRLRLDGPSLPDLYVDGDTGRILTVMDGSRAAYAWIYYALHSFNVPGLTTRPLLRQIAILLPLLAGLLFSITGVVVGWRRLRRSLHARGATRTVSG